MTVGVLDNANKSLDFVDKIQKLLEKLQNYKPEIKSLRVNYLTKATEMKLLFKIPQGVQRKFKDVEIPAYPGYSIKEVFDGTTLDRVEVDWQLKNQNWVADAKVFGASDRYLIILEGSISDVALERLVKLYCPDDPQRGSDVDRYWIDSAIKDMAILEKIYDELTLDKVTTCVNVGVERQFTSSIPIEVKNWIRARAIADISLRGRDREKAYRSFRLLKIAERRLGDFSPTSVRNLARDVLSPETFMYYISIDKPFHISHLNPLEESHWVPEKIGVVVETDLSYKTPVAQGDLIYKKIDFASRLQEEIKKLPGLPEKLRRTK
ncbi:MAG TPA: hypothetical protein VK487_09830 [Candidatus Bathyarchaeia archaeon]|nr:hypothetical protein [Candidatus Bathyarchaeia archaeon]